MQAQPLGMERNLDELSINDLEGIIRKEDVNLIRRHLDKTFKIDPKRVYFCVDTTGDKGDTRVFLKVIKVVDKYGNPILDKHGKPPVEGDYIVFNSKGAYYGRRSILPYTPLKAILPLEHQSKGDCITSITNLLRSGMGRYIP